MTPKIPKIVTDSSSFLRKSGTGGSDTRDESEMFQSPASPSPWKSKIPQARLDAIRRHFALLDRSKLNEVNDDIENSWNCGICLETAVDPCVTRCGHMYCHAHLSDWLATRPSCPVCKRSCTISEDIVRVFEREQLSPLLTPFVESFSQPSRSLTESPAQGDMIRSTTDSNNQLRDSSSTAFQPKLPGGFKLFLSDVYAHHMGLALRVVGLAILLAALLPGGFFSPSSQE